jgi:hypothetical protein
MFPRILCLDQSGVVGWCHGVPGVGPKPTPGSNYPPAPPAMSGSFKLGKSATKMSRRFRNLEDWLINEIKSAEIQRVYFEEPIAFKAAGSFASRMALYGYAAIIGVACDKAGVDCFTIPMTSWRSEIGAPTAAPKRVPKEDRRKWVKDATLAVVRRAGFEPKDDNEADAIGIWLCASGRILKKHSEPTLDSLFAPTLI